MIGGVYARRSTEQNAMGDEEKSIARQIEHARAFAARKGWKVADDYIYADDGVSGAEFIKRPGFLRLMNALKPKPPFQVLIMSEESRLGREQIETAYALKQIIDAGVRVFFYLEERERTLDSALDKVMLSLTNFAAEMEREKARQRTYDAMLKKAKKLHVTGGKVYGYDNLEVLSTERGADGTQKRLHVVRKINPEQAVVLRRIFEMYASGLGLTRIAKALNCEHVPPPRAYGKGWAPTAIREMLYRPLYRGQILWNKHQKIHRGGTKKLRRRSEDQWLLLEAPKLQIIPEDRWQTVHARLEQARAAYARSAETGQLQGRRSHRDLDSPYLLSGIGRCKACGGSLIAMTRGHRPKRGRFYGCSYNYKRGSTVCSNNVQIRQEILDHAVLQAIDGVLDDRIIQAAVDRALERLRAGVEDHLDSRTAIERELSLIEARARNLVEAIARGDAPDPLVVQLKAEEERKRALVKKLAGLASMERVASLDRQRIKRHLKARVTDVKGVLSRHTLQARQMLRKLVVDRIDFEPLEGEQRGYRFTGRGSYGSFLAGEAVPPLVVTPAGSDHLWTLQIKGIIKVA